MQAVIYVNKKYLGMIFEILKNEPIEDKEESIGITLNHHDKATIYLKNAKVTHQQAEYKIDITLK